ncbi:MAG TPA: Grx4 family monothiol glutaredoxin [Rhodocyclaceae bacterium]|nr:Grx4 family monothiol glutaredoxin [Rhodocyclaceae bacterium]
MSDLQATIKEQVTTNPVVLYMKGSPQFPQCGFSGRAVQVLKACGVNKFFSVDVLQNPEYRDALVTYANWPTLPQLYIKGEFIGGCDIMTEMYQAGELQPLLDGLQN